MNRLNRIRSYLYAKEDALIHLKSDIFRSSNVHSLLIAQFLTFASLVMKYLLYHFAYNSEL